MIQPHEGHRRRLCDKLSGEGLNEADDHQLLEALLFYAVPRCDTNEMAHALIGHFGSLDAVFAASTEELMAVESIGGSSAELIHLVGGIRRRLECPREAARRVYDSISKISTYLARRYVGATHERVYLMMFDNSMRLLDCRCVCYGSVNSAVFQPRLLIECALGQHAAAVIVAHNHPDGIAVPSGDDINTTERLRECFEMVNIQMLEHIVIADNSYAAIMRNRNMALVKTGQFEGCGAVSAELMAHFYEQEIVTDLPQLRSDGLNQL